MIKPGHFLRAVAIASLTAGIATLSGCASSASKPQSMLDPKADFNFYRTFGWDTGSGNQPSGQVLSIVDGNIRVAIAGELQRKGYEEAAAGANPDLVLQYETAQAETIKTSPFRIGVGMGSYGGSGGAGVGVSSSGARNVTEGKLVLRAVDPVRRAEVWNGHVSRELGKSGNLDQALIQGAVADLLREFPARGGQPQ